jgi:hypothetical protein
MERALLGVRSTVENVVAAEKFAGSVASSGLADAGPLSVAP